MNVLVTACTTLLLIPLFLVLSVAVIKGRRKHLVAIGDGGQKLIARRMRAQANFAEYTPITLILLLLNEQLGVSRWYLAPVAVVFVVARYVHGYGISQEKENFKFRVRGMGGTAMAIVLLTLSLAVGLVMQLLAS